MEEGLYRSEFEHDACGVGMVVNIKGNKTHELVSNALQVLANMRHRGAEGADGKSGDGAGIMVQIPHEFILLQGIPVPEKGSYGTGLVFLSKDQVVRNAAIDVISMEAEALGCRLMHVREVPTVPSCLGEAAASVEPDIRQIFITSKEYIEDDELELKLYRLRKHVEKKFPDTDDCYICSLSTRNIVYKGMLTSQQLAEYYPDLTSPWFTSGIALVHSRFSTNTFPRWCLAQPFRLLAHNGEINTIRGNRSWMKARESTFNGGRLGDISDMTPLIQEGMSDSASLDNALEFFTASGLGLAQAMSMLVPESFNERNPLSEDIRAFYEYHSILMAPWDGPSALFFSDGRYAGGSLDRNGLRPARYVLTKKNTIIVASEAGVLDMDPTQIAEKGRLEPGKMLLIDTQEGRILHDQEIKDRLAAEYPYRKWLGNNRIQLENLKNGRKILHSVNHHDLKLKTFGFTKDEIDKVIRPMCQTGSEPVGAMGCDTPLAVLSEKPQSFFNYFRQQFAQVTNPPIDSIREELVMSLSDYIGRVGTGILQPSESNCKMIRLPHPVLTNTKLDILAHLAYKGFRTVKVPMLFPLPTYESSAAKGQALEYALMHLCQEVERRVDEGYNYIILSDRDVDLERVPIPSLLAVSAVHHYLIEKGKRSQTAIIVEGGDIKETMHVALLLGFGASAVNPYMVYAVINSMVKNGEIQMNYASAKENYIAAVNKGLLKIMAKMGISTIKSYRGAKIFEAVGISGDVLQKYFGMPGGSTIGGIGLDRIERDTLIMYRGEYDPDEKEFHAWNPQGIRLLQKSVREGSYEGFRDFTASVDGKADPVVLRDCLEFIKAEKALPLDQVESEDEIVKHFVVGAMSFGALSKEAHETLALAMNALGSRSNTGEGGELEERFKASVNGVSLSSKVKQVASGRFGVTAEYLANAEEIQIKVAQGAKPGEGGQLPGFKVDEVIAKTRHSTPGVSLISPPPHHDIYSIEDLAQLIFDLRNVNPKAKISVKLVAESGVGTVAAGVAKAKADILVISGADGGTGASPVSSVKYAGIPAEIGLAEVQQSLMRNGLRSQVKIQTDGQIKTGRDIIILALLGAEEFGFGTMPMISMGCVMCRRCNTNTCAAGICTQDEACRARFKATPEHVMNMFRFLSREVRGYLSEMGFKSLGDIVGRTDLLIPKQVPATTKAASLDFSRLLFMENSDERSFRGHVDHSVDQVLDLELIKAAQPAIEWKDQISLDYPVGNTDRAVGSMLSGRIAARYGEAGLPDGTLNVKFVGSAGQSFAAFLCRGVNFRLEGETNDYFCKGLSGGVVSIIPPSRVSFKAEENMIAGNTGLYGATSGEVYVNGRVGQRFAVRNSGAVAVVEGAGDHCCEYMTGGRVVVLGSVGRNFAAGMSGGIAYVLDRKHDFDYWCNMDLVELSLVEKEADRNELKALLRAHLQHTGSQIAKEILEDWDNSVMDFLKVIPSEYRKLLEENKKNS